MTLLPSVIHAEYRGGFRIYLTFNDNTEKTVDFRQWLEGPVFEPLKAPGYFRRFSLTGAPSLGRTEPILRPRLCMTSGVLKDGRTGACSRRRRGRRVGKRGESSGCARTCRRENPSRPDAIR